MTVHCPTRTELRSSARSNVAEPTPPAPPSATRSDQPTANRRCGTSDIGSSHDNSAIIQPSPLTVLIDDSREFRDERPALVARSSQEALSLLEALRGRWIGHLWLDHDLGGDDTIRPVVDLMVQMASTGSPLDVGQIHIHTANVEAGHQMGVDLRAAGYAVVRSYSRGKHAVGKVFWPAQTSNIAIVNQFRAMASCPSP